MYQTIFPEYFAEPRTFQADVQQRSKVVWVGNCTSHMITPRLRSILAEKRICLRYLPPCAIHLCQPADTFIISKIKDVWTSVGKRRKSSWFKLVLSNIHLVEMAHGWENLSILIKGTFSNFLLIMLKRSIESWIVIICPMQERPWSIAAWP